MSKLQSITRLIANSNAPESSRNFTNVTRNAEKVCVKSNNSKEEHCLLEMRQFITKMRCMHAAAWLVCSGLTFSWRRIDIH